MFLKKLLVRTLFLFVLAVPLLFGGGLVWWVGANAKAGSEPTANGDEGEKPAAGGKIAAKPAPRPVTVVRPVARELAPYGDFAGRLRARKTVEVRSRVSAFVDKVCFEDGATVKKGDLLFQLDPREIQPALDKAEADLIQADARLKLAEVELERYKKLGGNVVTREDLDKATKEVAVTRAASRAARSAVDVARLNLEFTRILAPIDGTIERQRVDAGKLVTGGGEHATVLATITVRDPMGLFFDMDERSYLRYQALLTAREVGGPGSPLFIALVSDKDFPHRGTLDRFGTSFNPATGTIVVEGHLPNPKSTLLPGQFVRVRMPFGKSRKVLEVPEGAIQSDQGKRYVWVVTDKNVVEHRPVTLGEQDGDRRVILTGLTAEDWVVITEVGPLRPGDRIEPRPAPEKKG